VCWYIVNKGKRVEHLKLALAWNRFDVAKDEIFSGGAFWKVCSLVYFYAITVHFELTIIRALGQA